MLNRMLFLLLAGSSLFPLYSYGAIYLDRTIMPKLVLQAGNKDPIPYTFSVIYRVPCLSGNDCTKDNKAEKHRIGISGIRTDSGKVDHLLEDLKSGQVNLDPYIYSDDNYVQGTGTNNDRLHFNLGYWPSERRPGYVRAEATFEILFKAEIAERNSFCFHIIGEDTDGDYYRDSLPACLSIEVKDVVKISGLNDISLTTNNQTAESSACLYSTSGTVNLSFDSLNANAGKFVMLNGSEKVFYKFAIREPSFNYWEEYESEAEIPPIYYAFNANNEYENCNNENNIEFKITADGINASPGTYTDTMTIFVAPL